MTNLDVEITVPFPTSREALIAYKVLTVDGEPIRSGTDKTLTLSENTLHVKISGSEARKVRVSLTSFFDSLTLVTETLKVFGPLEKT